MLEKLITILAGWIISVISSLGYSGIVLLMAIESACIPLPSEIIMPFSGFLVFKGEMVLWGVALAGAVGCVLGPVERDRDGTLHRAVVPLVPSGRREALPEGAEMLYSQMPY